VLPRRQAVLSISQEIRQFNKGNFQREQDKIQRNRQELRRYLIKMAALSLSLGLLVALVSIVRISRLERWADEQHRLSELTGEELRRLSQQLVRAQEDERRTLSRELHDEVGQLLTALRMELGNLDQLRNGAGPQFQQHLEEARGLAGQALQEVRNLAMGLRPSMLDDLGLVPALEWQAREFSRRSGVPVYVQADGRFEGLPETTRTCVFRIVQEALTNCARHSGARSIHVDLQAGPAALSVRVEDDGVGFQQESVAGEGLGLRGIEERVRELGGRFQIRSQPRQGAVLQAEIPLSQEVRS
jgi:signal transduction histidine kinase